MTEPLRLGLLQNAFDYLLSAAEHAREGSARSYKYAVIHLATSIELLLKARLRHEHWSLLFADVNHANKAALQSGTFNSVDFETALKRLREIAGVVIPRGQLRHLRLLRHLRNRTLHFDLTLQEQHAKALVAKGSNTALDFYHQNLEALEQIDSAVLDSLHENLREFDRFVQIRLAAICDDVAAGQDVRECPRCWQDALVIGAFLLESRGFPMSFQSPARTAHCGFFFPPTCQWTTSCGLDAARERTTSRKLVPSMSCSRSFTPQRSAIVGSQSQL